MTPPRLPAQLSIALSRLRRLANDVYYRSDKAAIAKLKAWRDKHMEEARRAVHRSHQLRHAFNPVDEAG